MIIFKSIRTNEIITPTFIPKMTVFGSPDESLKLWNNYRRVLYHYYDKWYDFAESVRNGVGMEQREYVFSTEIPKHFTHKDYKGLKQNPDQIPIFQEFNWLPNTEVPLVAPPNTWVYRCGVKKVFSKLSVYSPGVFPDYLEISEIDFVTTYEFQYLANDSNIKYVYNVAFLSNLNIIVHTRAMNKKKLDLALDICKHSPADTVEIFENKIFIHVKNDCMHTLFNTKFYKYNDKKVKYNGKVYEATFQASPKLKLTEYQK